MHKGHYRLLTFNISFIIGAEVHVEPLEEIGVEVGEVVEDK